MATADGEVSIQLAPMQQLNEVTRTEDDWTGLTDSSARRKLQNRLNQRAYRRRKAFEGRPISISQQGNAPYNQQGQSKSPSSSCSQASANEPEQQSLAMTSSPAPLIPYTSNSRANPIQPNTVFPLPVDHLITLVQYNVLRATLTNMSLLSLLDAIPTECRGALGVPTLPIPSSIPPSLAPTPLQRSTRHPLWIDIMPLGAMRDNLILQSGNYDEDDLCCDLVGGLFEGFNDLELKGVLVWSDPWDPSGWEVTEGFAKKWGFLLKGCEALVESTNKWRVMRNEDRLIVEI